MYGRTMSIDLIKTSVDKGSITQVFGGYRSSTRRTSSIVYSRIPAVCSMESTQEALRWQWLRKLRRLSLKKCESLSDVNDGNVAEACLSLFKTDDTDLHSFLGFPLLLAMHVFQYKFSFCWYNECINFTWAIHAVRSTSDFDFRYRRSRRREFRQSSSNQTLRRVRSGA
jgi:hypothetical protein